MTLKPWTGTYRMSLSLYGIHRSSFADYTSGLISFSDCWAQQRNILDKCEQILKDQIKELQGISLRRDVNVTESKINKEDNEDVKNITDESSTWSVGILSNFLQRPENEEKNRRDEQKPSKESLTDFLPNLKPNKTKKNRNKQKPHTGKGSFNCPECNFKSSIFWNLKVHLGTHIGSIFQCTLCEEVHRRKFNVMEHIRLKHQDKKRLANRKWVDMFIVCHCETCDVTGTVVEYDQHLHTQHHLPRHSKRQ